MVTMTTINNSLDKLAVNFSKMEFDDGIDVIYSKNLRPRTPNSEEGMDVLATNVHYITDGWADENVKSARSRSSNLIEEERFKNENYIDSDNDDIPIIPDLDEIQEELSSNEVKTPPVFINKSTYKELDKELSIIETSSSKLQSIIESIDIDLSLFKAALLPEQDVQESDEEWTMESLSNDFTTANTPV